MNLFRVVILFLFINSIQGDDDNGDCRVEGISDIEWSTQLIIKDSVNDTEKKTIFSGASQNITAMEFGDFCDADGYFCTVDNGTTFEIITKNLSGMDNSTRTKIPSSPREIIPKITINCTNGKTKTLTFKVTVNDVNTHKPEFEKNSYSYSLPMPMPPNINIMDFGDVIKVYDFDFSNYDITLSPSGFEGLSFSVDNGSSVNYSYVLRNMDSSKVLKLSKPITFSLTATDTGIPPLSSTVLVTLNINETISEPPEFTKSSYIYDYDPDEPTIKPRNGKMELQNTMNQTMVCNIPENYQKYLDIHLNENRFVELNLTNALDKTVITDGLAEVTVSCYVQKNLGVSVADIIIYSSKATTDSTKFNKKTYSGQYTISSSNNSTISMSESITINNKVDGYVASIDDTTLNEYLTIEGDPIRGWTLGVKELLGEDFLKQTELNLVITLKKQDHDEVIDDTFVTLLLPNEIEGIDFKKSYFSGNYVISEDGGGFMDPITIELNSNYFDIDGCRLEDSDYNEFFAISCDENSKEQKLTLKSSIDKKYLKTGVLTLSIYMDLKLGENLKRRIRTAIILNLSKDGTTTTTSTTTSTTSTTTDPPSNKEPDDCSNTGWIITTIVVFILLVIYIIVTVVYYFKRIRNRNEMDYSDYTETIARRTETTARRPELQPHFPKRSSEKFKDVSTRRPTGFIRYNPDQDRDSLDSEYGDSREEVNNNTNANRFLNELNEIPITGSNVGKNDKRNIGFDIPPPPPEPLSS